MVSFCLFLGSFCSWNLSPSLPLLSSRDGLSNYLFLLILCCALVSPSWVLYSASSPLFGFLCLLTVYMFVFALIVFLFSYCFNFPLVWSCSRVPSLFCPFEAPFWLIYFTYQKKKKTNYRKEQCCQSLFLLCSLCIDRFLCQETNKMASFLLWIMLYIQIR